MSRVVRETHMMKYGSPGLGHSPPYDNSRASTPSGNKHFSPPTSAASPKPGTPSTSTSKRHTLDTRVQTVRHINTLFPAFIDDSPTANYLSEATPGSGGAIRGGGLGSSGYGSKATAGGGKKVVVQSGGGGGSVVAAKAPPRQKDGTSTAGMLSVDLEYKIRLQRERKERALRDQEYPVDWRRAPSTQYDSLKAAIATGSPIGRQFFPRSTEEMMALGNISSGVGGGGGRRDSVASRSSSVTTTSQLHPHLNVPFETKLSGVTWVYAAINLSILPDRAQATADATRLIDRLFHNQATSEFQLPLVIPGKTRRSDVRGMLRDPRRFGLLIDIVATRRTIMTGVPHNVATAIYHHCNEHYPIFVKFVFVGVTDNGTKRVARDVFAGGNVPKNSTGVWASAEGGVPHPLPFDAIDSEHQFIAHPSGEEADRLQRKGQAEKIRAEQESAARRCTAKYVPPPPPEWLVRLQAREEKKKLRQQKQQQQPPPTIMSNSFTVSNATLLYGTGDGADSSPVPRGNYEQLYGRSSGGFDEEIGGGGDSSVAAMVNNDGNEEDSARPFTATSILVSPKQRGESVGPASPVLSSSPPTLHQHHPHQQEGEDATANHASCNNPESSRPPPVIRKLRLGGGEGSSSPSVRAVNVGRVASSSPSNQLGGLVKNRRPDSSGGGGRNDRGQSRPGTAERDSTHQHNSLVEEVNSRRQINVDVAKYFGTPAADKSAAVSERPHSPPTKNLPSFPPAFSNNNTKSTTTLHVVNKVTAGGSSKELVDRVSSSHGSHLIQGGSNMLLRSPPPLSNSNNNSTIHTNRSISVGGGSGGAHLNVIPASGGRPFSGGGIGGGGSPIAQQRRHRRRQLLDSSMNPDASGILLESPNSTSQHRGQLSPPSHPSLEGFSSIRDGGGGGREEEDGMGGGGHETSFNGSGGNRPQTVTQQCTVSDVSASLRYVGANSVKQQQNTEWAKIGTRVGQIERGRASRK